MGSAARTLGLQEHTGGTRSLDDREGCGEGCERCTPWPATRSVREDLGQCVTATAQVRGSRTPGGALEGSLARSTWRALRRGAPRSRRGHSSRTPRWKGPHPRLPRLPPLRPLRPASRPRACGGMPTSNLPPLTAVMFKY